MSGAAQHAAQVDLGVSAAPPRVFDVGVVAAVFAHASVTCV